MTSTNMQETMTSHSNHSKICPNSFQIPLPKSAFQISQPEQSLPTRPKTSHWSKSPHQTKDAPLEKVPLPQHYLPTGASLLTRAKSHHWNKTPHQSKVLPLEQVSPPEQSLPRRLRILLAIGFAEVLTSASHSS